MNPDKLFDYLDGKLSPAERTQLEEKLMSDEQLRKQFAIAREIHRGGGASREVMVPANDAAAVERSGRMGRRILAGAAILVFLNVAVGLGVITWKNKKPAKPSREAEIRQQLEASLGAAAQNAMPTPSFVEGELALEAPRAEWNRVADRVVEAASAFGGSAAKGLPADDAVTVMVDIPSHREAEFRRALTSAVTITPMPAVAPGVRDEQPVAGESKERTIMQVRIAEAAR
jgi:anti-sigma factor RsiW